MRPYEVMVILDATLEEEGIRTILDRSTDVIRTNGGTPGRVDKGGKRRFAYEMKKRNEGYYALIEATAEPAAMAELDRMLHLADEVLRHKVIRLPDHVAGRGARPVSVPDAPPTEAPVAEAAEATEAPIDTQADNEGTTGES
ncbi:MAG TPA: 30S ribosomal protein S6 [Acidimicrobiales bacterium]|nr:30S ribosomal protein S6 [Acidimicrobiales bacterium]